jgi:hypothetical protein
VTLGAGSRAAARARYDDSIYHPTCYGAFVLDADGNNVEAVCHKPE